MIYHVKATDSKISLSSLLSTLGTYYSKVKMSLNRQDMDQYVDHYWLTQASMKKEHSLSHRIYVLKADLVSIPVELVDLWAVGNFFEDSLTKQGVDRFLPMFFFFFNVIFSFLFLWDNAFIPLGSNHWIGGLYALL